MKVEMITGFTANTDDLKTQDDVKLHEVDGRFVAIYFDGVCLAHIYVMLKTHLPLGYKQFRFFTLFYLSFENIG